MGAGPTTIPTPIKKVKKNFKLKTFPNKKQFGAVVILAFVPR
jgi:hypothetical protein